MGKRITDEMLKEAVAQCESVTAVLRFFDKKAIGGNISYYSTKIKKLGLDTSHFKCGFQSGDIRESTRLKHTDVLVLRESGMRTKAYLLRRCLMEVGRLYQCECCGQLPEWLGNPLTLDVDHINENWLDDRAENLRFLCPNCHSQFSRRLKDGG